MIKHTQIIRRVSICSTKSFIMAICLLRTDRHEHGRRNIRFDFFSSCDHIIYIVIVTRLNNNNSNLTITATEAVVTTTRTMKTGAIKISRKAPRLILK